ncbi:hypothetical protein FJT64_007817 [Amphibalanus amphitrite]|uniref:SGNH hydrolase-type esterase domain-containing protein n=1 Tax=Amphibalanus amphitrite TaxID=1232801 RepID=A0A6A4VSY9_AMPAM|nr:hypothetical protein FJT64_007817 [Amphibalanus amphitrite]
MHLVLGDSIARRATISSRLPDDLVLNRAKGGETWRSLLERLETEVAAWQTAATAANLLPGIVVLWLTGNEVYSRLSLLASFDKALLTTVGRTAAAVIARLKSADQVIVLGPLPRLAGEMHGVTWEYTAAYHLERTLVKLDTEAKIVPLGRALTRKISKNRHGLKGCEGWYLPDGIHLSPEGYQKLADIVPLWLTLS